MSDFLANFIEFVRAYGVVGLAAVSFAESSFFPIPPDVLLIPMAFMNRRLALLYALVTTVSSVFGGIFGHIIGRKLGKPILRRFFKEETINKVEDYFKKYGGWSIAVAGFTPIPYKAFTISAGAFNVRVFTLIMASLLGRGARFFLEGLFIFFVGDAAKYYIENYFEVFTIIITVSFVIIYYIWKRLKNARRVKGTGVMAYIRSWFDKLYMFTVKYRKYDEAALYFFISIFTSFISLFILLELIEDYLTRGNWQFDTLIMSSVQNLKGPILDNVFKVITMAGNTIPMMVITFASVVFMIYIKKGKEGLLLLVNNSGLWVFNILLKQVFKRQRPIGFEMTEAMGYSFPSGHAMIFMGFSILLVYYILIFLKGKRARIFLSISILVFSVLVGFSRVYLGVHYMSDVLAGWFAGILWTSTIIVIYKALGYRQS